VRTEHFRTHQFILDTCSELQVECRTPMSQLLKEVSRVSARRLNSHQLAAMLRAARKTSERDWALILISACHGLRASEAIKLTPENFSEGRIRLRRLKGSLPIDEPLREEDEDILNERLAVKWISSQARGEALFPVSRFQFYRLIRRYGQEAGVPEDLCHPHVLKHFAAVRDIRRTVGPNDGRPPENEEIGRRGDALRKETGLSWPLIAKQVIPEEYFQNPRKAGEQLRLAVRRWRETHAA